MGRLSAYIIELILACEKLIPLKSSKELNHLIGPHSDNYVYASGVIVKENKKLIDQSDLVHLQKIYKDWWDRNKDKSIEDLRKNWREGDRPLKKTRYSWE